MRIATVLDKIGQEDLKIGEIKETSGNPLCQWYSFCIYSMYPRQVDIVNMWPTIFPPYWLIVIKYDMAYFGHIKIV